MECYAYFDRGAGRYREKFGIAFEDIRLGLKIRHRPGIDVSQRDNQLDSVDLINNAHLHYDSRYASETEWGKPLSVSTMTVQRFFGMASRSWYRRRRILGIDSLALTGPVMGDDTLYTETEVTDVRDTGDNDVGEISLKLTGLNASGTRIADIACRMEIYRRGRHPEDPRGIEEAREQRFASHHPADDGFLVEQTGLFFEELVNGETFEHWPHRRITADEVRMHALRSLEMNPRWHDPNHVNRTEGLQPEVWEPLVLGAVTALTTRTFGRVVANLGWTDIRFPNPMQPGESLRAESTVLDLRSSSSRPDQGIATVETRGFAGDDRLVCSYQRVLLVYRQGAGPYKAAGY